MYEFKKLSPGSVPAAVDKARCYRFLNEPREAESICLDILEVEPDNTEALVMLLLARTDQFPHHLTPKFDQAMELLPRLGDAYSKAYYEGLICERRGKVHLKRNQPGSGSVAYEWIEKAMDLYEKAIAASISGNEDAVLRWNTCARAIMENPGLKKEEGAAGEQMLE